MPTHLDRGTGLRLPISTTSASLPATPATTRDDADESTPATNAPNRDEAHDSDWDNFSLASNDEQLPTGLQPGAFKIFYTNQQELPPNKKMSYILLMHVDIINQDKRKKYLSTLESAEEDGTQAPSSPTILDPKTFVEENEPWKTLSLRKGYKSKLVATKDMMRGEYVCRIPQGKASAKNTTVTKYMELLCKHPLDDPGDLIFIEEELQTFLQSISNQFTAEAENPVDGNLRLTKIDRLRFLVLFVGNETVMATYLRSTDGKDRIGVEYTGTDEAPPDWRELMVELFNDPMVEAKTIPHPTLHEDYHEEINCPKGEYTLTLDRCDKLLTDQKGKLRDIIHRYNMSGNGSDMAVYEGDSDEEDGAAERSTENEATFGRFNAGRAQRRAMRREGLEYLQMTNGDDRKEFLRSAPTDILYWWSEFDKYNLIYFYMGKLDDDNGASCDKVPGDVSYKKRKSEVDDSTKSAKALSL